MAVRVIDVSKWQGLIDWRAVAADGVAGAWIKVGGTEGGAHYRDPRAAENLAGAEAAGLPFGTYYFASPGHDDARAQAQHAVVCGHGRGILLPAADLEVNPNGLSQLQFDVWASEFCAEVARQIDRESVVYTYSGARLVGYTDAAPGHCRLWIANYGRADVAGTQPPNFNPPVPPAWGSWDAWQFNSATRVAGIRDSTCDQSVVTDEFWSAMTNPPEEDEMALTVKFIAWTRPNSHWAEDVAKIPVNDDPNIGRAGAFLVYDVAGTVKHILTPEHLAALHYVGVEDRGFQDDWTFQSYELVGPGSPD